MLIILQIFFDISFLPNKRSATIVTHTKGFFSKCGISKKVASDNGPEYIRGDYKLFAKQWVFKHDSSSPHYPKSNGQIERTIQTIKKTLKKTFKSNDDSYLVLVALRTSPGLNSNTPSATLLYSRPIRTILPSMNTNIAINNKKIYRKSNTDEYNYTNLPQLKKNDKVKLHDVQTWKIKGEIVEYLNEPPRSYLMRTEKGISYVVIENRYYLEKGEIGIFILKMNDQYLFNVFDKTNNTTNQTPYNLCNEVQETTNVTQTRSGRIKRPSRYDDYVIK